MRLCLLVLLAPLFVQAQNLKEFEKKVTEFTLPNGLHFIVMERHDAPVVSFNTYVNAGSLDDPAGQTGLAHMFEHMAFKGTPQIGSTNWPEEKKALAEVESIYARLEAERRKDLRADPKKSPRSTTSSRPPSKRRTSLSSRTRTPRLSKRTAAWG